MREEDIEAILESKREKGLTFAAIAGELGKRKIWATVVLLGQYPTDARFRASYDPQEKLSRPRRACR